MLKPLEQKLLAENSLHTITHGAFYDGHYAVITPVGKTQTLRLEFKRVKRK